MVLGIVGLVFSFLLPAVSYSCAVPGLLIGLRKSKKNYSSTAGISLNIIAIVFAAINSVLGIIMTIKMYKSNSKDKKSVTIK